jgi:hypothetical protein
MTNAGQSLADIAYSAPTRPANIHDINVNTPNRTAGS